jgi:hypothetical protein
MSFRKIFQMINRLYSVRRGVDVRKNVHIGLGTILIKQPDVWTFGFMPLSHLGIPI